MNRRTGLGRAMGVLSALGLSTALLASSCTESESNDPNGTSGAGAGAGGTSASAASGGTVATAGGGATGSGGSVVATGGTVQTGGGGATGATGGTSAGTATVGGAGAGGTPVATGGVPTAGQAGSTSGSAGTETAGSGGGSACGGFTGPCAPPALGTWPPPAIKFTDVVMGVTQPTAIAAPRADRTRLYVTEKWGRIRLIKDGVLQAEPALDMRDAVLEGGPQTGAELMNQGKRGLVGLAFHPNYEANGRIFVLYVADQGEKGVYGTTANSYDDGDMTISEYRRSTSNPDIFDPQPVAEVLQFDKGDCNQCSQHNGGSLEIDVDGFLWASTGDPPPYENAGSQDLNNLNGKLLRFDISADTVVAAGNYPGADPFVASVGIRNAYKFSVDRFTGDIYVGDVGENDVEEITVERYGQRNKNHAWPMKEGTTRFFDQPCDDANCLDPVYEYGHTGTEGTPNADNCIVGGYVYRGQAIPALQGAYIYGDYGSGRVRAIQVQAGALVQPAAHTFNATPAPSVFMGCFGEDAAGELYVCDYNNNKILRVDAQ